MKKTQSILFILLLVAAFGMLAVGFFGARPPRYSALPRTDIRSVDIWTDQELIALSKTNGMVGPLQAEWIRDSHFVTRPWPKDNLRRTSYFVQVRTALCHPALCLASVLLAILSLVLLAQNRRLRKELSNKPSGGDGK